MKNFVYILVLILSILIFSYLVCSCSSLLDNEFTYEKVEGRTYMNDAGNKIVFNNEYVYMYFNNEKYIFTNYEILVDNMISIEMVDDNAEIQEIRLYFLKNNMIYSTFDSTYYELRYVI